MKVDVSSRGARLAALWMAIGVACAAVASGGSDPFFTSWETFGRAEGLPSDKVLAVAVDGDRVWAGTEDGLALIQGGEIDVLSVADGLPFRVVTALTISPDTGDLWIGTMGGVARYSSGRIDAFTQVNSGLANDVVYDLAMDGEVVWIATAAGLNRYDPVSDVWEIFDVSNTLMHEPWCYAVTVADGDVYVAVWGGGVVVRDRDTQQFREHRDPDSEMEIDLFRDDGLIHDVTSAVAVSEGVMWVGTYFGLSRYEDRRWRSYSVDDSGLPGDFINSVAAENRVAWIATDQGLGRFDSETWHSWVERPDGAGWELRTTTAGGQSRATDLWTGPGSSTIFAIAIDREDVWLATAAGLSHGIARPETEGRSVGHQQTEKE